MKMREKILLCFLLMVFISLNTNGQSQKYSDYYYQRVSLFKLLPIDNNDIVFIGNSITDYAEWAEIFNNPNIKNRGISGDIAQGVYERLDPIIEGKPAKIFLMIGVNDISHNLSADSIVSAILKVAEKIKINSPDTKLFIQSLLPVNEDFGKYFGATKRGDIVIEINRKLELVCNKMGITYIDVYSHLISKNSQKLDPRYTNDGLHLLGEGYLVWKSLIADYI